MDPEDPYSDPDHFQNSTISSFYLFRHILKISSKSIHKFLSYIVHIQTHLAAWIRMIQTVIQITPKILSH